MIGFIRFLLGVAIVMLGLALAFIWGVSWLS